MYRRNIMKILLQNKKFAACSVITLALVLLGLIGPYFTYDPLDYVGRMYEPPSLKHLCGTDIFGRDIFAQLVYGLRNSLLVGVLAGAFSLIIAMAIGGISGYVHGLIGEAFNALINIFLVLPTIPLLIFFSALIRMRSIVLVALFIAFISGWPGSARALRAMVLSLREKEFINLAIITGKKTRHIIFGEIFSNMIAYIFLQFCGACASAILAEAGISLLGLGPTDVPTLGMMLHWAMKSLSLQIGVWWWFFPPGLVLVLLIACLYTMSSTMPET